MAELLYALDAWENDFEGRGLMYVPARVPGPIDLLASGACRCLRTRKGNSALQPAVVVSIQAGNASTTLT